MKSVSTKVALSLLLALAMLIPAAVTLAQDEEEQERVILSTEEITAGVEETFSVYNLISDKDKEDNSYSYESGNTEVATVDENGTATAVSEGETVIIVSRVITQTVDEVETKSTLTAELKLVVGAAPSSVKLCAHNIALGVNNTYKLNLSLTGCTASGCVFESTDETVAAVDENGAVTANSAGEAQITAKTYNGVTDTCTVYVTKKAPTIKITTKNNKLQLGATNHKISYTFNSEGLSKAVKFYSSRTNVATIDQNGKLSGKQKGWTTVTIFTSFDNVRAWQAVNVVDVPLSLSRNSYQIALDNSNVSRMQYGKSVKGRPLEAYIIVNKKKPKYKKTLFIDFAVHGFEDSYYRDGKKLVEEANKLIQYFAYHSELLGKYRLIIVPCANPDGTIAGNNNLRACGSAYGRCTAKHIDMNRDFRSFKAVESRKLRDFIKKSKPSVYLNMHGWLNESMGNAKLCKLINKQQGFSKRINSYGDASGYVIGWVNRKLHIPAALVEYRSPKAISTTKDINMIKAIIKTYK